MSQVEEEKLVSTLLDKGERFPGVETRQPGLIFDMHLQGITDS